MPRPTLSTPVADTLKVIRATADLCREHTGAIESVLGEGFDASALARRLARGLADAQRAFAGQRSAGAVRCQRRRELVVETQRVVSATLARVELAFFRRADLSAIRARFASRPPLHIQTMEHARAAVADLQDGFATYGPALGDSLRGVEELGERIDALAAAVEEEADRPEATTLDRARRSLNLARQDVLELLRRIQLVAEAVEVTHPEFLADLHHVFETHNPTRPNTTADEPAVA